MRRSPFLTLLAVLLIACVFFAVSDARLARSARESLLQRILPGCETSDPSGSSDAGGKGSGADWAGSGSLSQEDLEAGALPEWSGDTHTDVNGGVPKFPDDVLGRAGDGTTPYEYYGVLDDLGRCTAAYGCLGDETMPDEGQERGDISSVHPSGWARAQGWERCHLIAWALSAENANPQNLITGTHYLNYDGMRPLEEEVEHYIWNTGNHVLYMARPYYRGDELVARGVQLTAQSVEDNGRGIAFNVYLFNVTPGAEINYRTGIVTTGEQAAMEARVYIINTRSGVFHYPTCEGVREMSKHNRKEVTATRSELTRQGYVPCGYCEP